MVKRRKLFAWKPVFVLWSLIMANVFATSAAVDYTKFPDPKEDLKRATNAGNQTLVLAGGCFWCTEGVFEAMPGVLDVVSGYAGGTAQTANYNIVSLGATDHAEAIRIIYDPKKTTFGKLLKTFFSIAHDPTQLNRQGPDVGRQYRSAIFFANEEERKVADAYIKQLTQAKVFGAPIVTTLEPLKEFFPAETYHQDFVRNNPSHPYIVQQAFPKLQKAKAANAADAARK